MVLLVSDLQELTANPDRPAIGTIVEAELDKARGAVATALVQTGTLNVGDIIVVGETFGRVRALENERGKRVKSAGPASAVVVLGLSEVPEAGDILRVVADDKAARAAVEQRKTEVAAKGGDGSGRATLEDLYSQIQAGQAKELRIILKSDVSGSLGAITHALEQLDQDEVRVNVLHEAAGDITDNDIMLAAASNAIVVGFSTSITDTARRAAEAEGVDVRLYDIIYKLTDDIDAASRACSSRRSWRSSRAGQRSARSSASARTRSSPGRTSPTGGSSAAMRASGVAARSSRPTGSSRCGASATTSARSRRTTNAASGSRRSIEEGDIIECTAGDGSSRGVTRIHRCACPLRSSLTA